MNEQFEMKKTMFLIFFFTMLVLSVFGQDNPRVTIVNNTGYTVYYVYISERAARDWEEDIMRNDVLLNGDYVNVRLLYPLTTVNRYDIKLVDEDGDAYIKWNVLITPNARIVFTLDDLNSQIADSDSQISEEDFVIISWEAHGVAMDYTFSLLTLTRTNTAEKQALSIYLNNLLYGGKIAEIYIVDSLETVDYSRNEDSYFVGGYHENFSFEVKGKFLFIKREFYAVGASSDYGIYYYIIDMQVLKLLTIDDILINTNSQRFKQLVVEHFKNYGERFNDLWEEDTQTIQRILRNLEGSLKEKNYSIFYDKEGIGFYWPVYVLGDKIHGEFDVIIPWTDIWNYLTPVGKELR